MKDNNIDIALIRDPHYNSGILTSFPNGWQRHHSRDYGAWIVVSNNRLKVNFQRLFESTAFAIITLDDQTPLIIGSQYVRPHADLEEAFNGWKEYNNNLHNNKLIIAGDYNGCSEIWGRAIQTQEDIKIIQNTIEMNLKIANVANSINTFQKNGRKGWPDITLTNNETIDSIIDWSVQDIENNSDHKYITFNYGSAPGLSKPQGIRASTEIPDQ